ncbi:hypothetical protein BJG93_31870 (plasmid) [Paraburkholderia sprentiae WSM5005]|uniref:Glycosyltransferase (GlcNAc) n=1 Tax=Paraburkholderia sprentiae WSM5005 TaxID=754502 RepID=A0A1I9YUV3_9BURK|nr:GlcNAc-transferase family protein [Paraburkholderia sprentiae]APA90021.1 hypothetical protein BJG93_31870 [Paraburkholderia sprentiae WSM5005]
MIDVSVTLPNSIFVQIASYRDPQLIPTLLDFIHQARKPDLLRIVVCWQHAPDETIGQFWQQGFGKWRTEQTGSWTIQHLNYGGAKIELIDVPHMMSQGACWARNLLQQRYGGERYTLQLDSHHRFVDGWDTLVIDMLESLRDESPKPVLTTYLPMFDPENHDVRKGDEPRLLAYSSFSKDGVVVFRSKKLSDWRMRTRPVRTRFFSAHFAFADGHFAEAVQHDPHYFFLGEEISIAVRAFTHGYDLYCPHRLIAWHEYKRSYRVKIWNDHTQEAKERGDVEAPWTERNQRSFQRNRALLGVDGETLPQRDFGKYGLGAERTLADYEAYAGICFALRGIQKSVLNDEVPVPAAQRVSEATWKASLLRANDVRVCVHRNSVDKHALIPGIEQPLSAATSAVVAIFDNGDTELCRKIVDAGRLSRHRNSDWLDFHETFESELEQIPAYYVVELFDHAGNMLSRVRRTIDA